MWVYFHASTSYIVFGFVTVLSGNGVCGWADRVLPWKQSVVGLIQCSVETVSVVGLIQCSVETVNLWFGLSDEPQHLHLWLLTVFTLSMHLCVL